MKKATPNDWKNFPMEKPKNIPIWLKISDLHFEKLQIGWILHQMEDKWFIYYADEWLYFHRSWTGSQIFKAQIHKAENDYFIKNFWVETDPEKFNMGDETQIVDLFCVVLAKILLGVEVSEIQDF